MDKAIVVKHLEEQRERLRALILYLEERGNNHLQYNQLDNCKIEFQTVISQLDRLKNKM